MASKPSTNASTAAVDLAVDPAVDPAAKPRRDAVADSSEKLSRSDDCLSFTRDVRLAKPVRMGAVMIQLLKRYGITDREIAEGVANYARKHQQAMAS